MTGTSKSIFTAVLLMVFSIFSFAVLPRLEKARATTESGWGNWYDITSCVVSSNACGVSDGTKTQQRDQNGEVCDQGCPQYTFETSRQVQDGYNYADKIVDQEGYYKCPNNYTEGWQGDWHYCQKNNGQHEIYDFWYKAEWVNETYKCPDGFENNPGHSNCRQKKYVTENYSKTFTYEKSNDPNKCHKPTPETLDIPTWARDDFGNNVPEWQDSIPVNCHQEIVNTQTQSVTCQIPQEEILTCTGVCTDPEATNYDSDVSSSEQENNRLCTYEDKVNICHNTSSESNPFEAIRVNVSAFDGEGQNDHTLHGDFVYNGPINEQNQQPTKPDGDLWCENHQPTDVCSNLDGDQTTIPDGYHRGENNDCDPNEQIPVDVCSNLEGNQESVPRGYHLEGESTCVQDPEATPTPTPGPGKSTDLQITALSCDNRNFDGKVTLTDNGQPVKGVKVRFTYHFVIVDAVTDENGKAQAGFWYQGDEGLKVEPENGFPSHNRGIALPANEVCPNIEVGVGGPSEPQQLAQTGVIEDTIMQLLGTVGGLMTMAGAALYAKKIA